jgi:hypothetical protein
MTEVRATLCVALLTSLQHRGVQTTPLLRRKAPDGTELWTYSILTTAACPKLEWLHDRMPVVLPTAAAQRAWLSAPASQLPPLYSPCDDTRLTWWPVTTKMNSMTYESPDASTPTKRAAVKDAGDLFAMLERRKTSITASAASPVGSTTPPTVGAKRKLGGTVGGNSATAAKRAGSAAADAAEARAKAAGQRSLLAFFSGGGGTNVTGGLGERAMSHCKAPDPELVILDD